MILFRGKHNLLAFGFMSEHVYPCSSRMVQQKDGQFVLSTVSDNSPLNPALFTAVSQGMITATKTKS